MEQRQRQTLLDKIAEELEGDERGPLTPIVRKAARLAAELGELEYRTLFQLHLDGVGPREGARAHQLGKDIAPARRMAAMKALLRDRELPSGKVMAHALPQIEELCREFLTSKETSAMPRAMETLSVLSRIRNRVGVFVIDAASTIQSPAGYNSGHPVTSGSKVFIGHGRSRLWTELRDFLRDRLRLDWTEFSRDPTAGLTVSERLEQMLNESAFAFLLMTAEDLHDDGNHHARENVVHEIGLTQGRLGRSRAIVLLEDGCSEFSNINGLQQIRFPRGQLMAKSEEIRQVLEREGFLTTDDGGSR